MYKSGDLKIRAFDGVVCIEQSGWIGKEIGKKKEIRKIIKDLTKILLKFEAKR